MPSGKKDKTSVSDHKRNLVVLLTFLLVMVVSGGLLFGIYLRTSTKESSSEEVKKVSQQVASPPVPVLVDNVRDLELTAESALAIDLESDIVLFEKNPDLKLLPASTTKIITSLVAMDYYPLDKTLKVSKVNVEGQKMHLIPGEEISARDLLYGLLVFSANDAAEVLAENYPGGESVFIAAMNLKAKELELEDTSFTNPAGLDSEGHLTTARDLSQAARHAMENPVFAEIVATKEKVVKSVDGKVAHRLVNLNELVGEVSGVLGVKTGWTENAKENLVTYIKRGDRKMIIVLLGSQDRFGETRSLINWIFSSYNWELQTR